MSPKNKDGNAAQAGTVRVDPPKSASRRKSTPGKAVAKAGAGVEVNSIIEADIVASDPSAMEFMERTKGMIKRSKLACVNGLRVSVQANEFVYCSPRENKGPYDSVELGFPSSAVEVWAPWAEEPAALTNTVYARVPVGAVAYVISSMGGRDPHQKDWTARSMCGDGPVVKSTLGGQGAMSSEPAKVRLGDAKVLCEVMGAWVQAAVLGSPLEEQQCRFEIWSAEQRVGPWSSVSTAFMAAGFEAASENDWRPWAEKLSELCELELASCQAPARKRRIAL